MSRCRLLPTPAQQAVLRDHCGHDPANPAGRPSWRKAGRHERGSNRRGRVRHAIARLRARETDRRTDWAEKVSTGLARRFDTIRVEDLQIKSMTRSAKGTRDDPGRNVRQKAGLNRGILGGDGAARPVNREPHLLASLTGRGWLESPAFRRGRMSMAQGRC